jgi:hypothetical protein
LWDKELEFFARRFLEMNYFWKVEKMIFEKATWGVLGKLLGRLEMQRATGVNALEKSEKWKLNCWSYLVIIGHFLGNFVWINFSWKRAIVGRGIGARGNGRIYHGGREGHGGKDEGWGICHRERRGHREMKWAGAVDDGEGTERLWGGRKNAKMWNFVKMGFGGSL